VVVKMDGRRNEGIIYKPGAEPAADARPPQGPGATT